MSGVSFYTVTIGLMSGIFVRSFFDSGYSGIVWCLFVAALLLLASFIVGQKGNYQSVLFVTFLFCISLSAGMLRLHVDDTKVPDFLSYQDTEVTLEARVIGEPEIRDTTIHLRIRVDTDPAFADERVLVTTDRYDPDLSTLSYGDRVTVEGTLQKPEPFLTDVGKVFDYEGYLKAQGVSFIIPFAKVRVEHEETSTFFGSIFTVKQRFQAAVEESIPEPQSGLGEGILLGVKRALPSDLEEVFREVGIIHIVVLSGYNIMIVVSCVMYVLSRFFYPYTRMILGIGVIVLFAICVGLSATVVRASLMAILLLLARGYGRRYAILRALMCTGIIMLFLNPYLLVHDPGFQLSFLATLGLILLAPYIESKLVRVPTTFGAREFLTATLATQIFVLPLILYYTGMISIIAVVANVLVLPMVSIAMLLSFITGIVTLFSSTLGFWIGSLAYVSLEYIITIAELCARVPFASITINTFPCFAVALLYILLALWTYWINTEELRVVKDSTMADRLEHEYSGWVIETAQSKSPMKMQK